MLTDNFDTDHYVVKHALQVGDLIPHLKLADLNNGDGIFNVRQYLSSIQYERHMSMEFTITFLKEETEICSGNEVLMSLEACSYRDHHKMWVVRGDGIITKIE